LLDPGSDFPSQARYLVYAGTQVAGHPFGPDEDGAQPVIDASQEFLTAIIEGTPQDGMNRISGRVPTVRLLSFNQDYVNRRLRPAPRPRPARAQPAARWRRRRGGRAGPPAARGAGRAPPPPRARGAAPRAPPGGGAGAGPPARARSAGIFAGVPPPP